MSLLVDKHRNNEYAIETLMHRDTPFFTVRLGKYYITLEPEGLTNKTTALVRIGNIDVDEEIGRI